MAAGVTTTAITTPEGRFTADVAGAAGAPLVLLLHGFPQSRHSWREQIPALSAVGYRAVAEHRRPVSVEDRFRPRRADQKHVLSMIPRYRIRTRSEPMPRCDQEQGPDADQTREGPSLFPSPQAREGGCA